MSLLTDRELAERSDAIERIKAVLGPAGWTQDPQTMAPHLAEWRGHFTGSSPLMVMPRTTEEVAAVVRIAAEARLRIVAQGGNTGLVRGGMPDDSGEEILFSLKRMNTIRSITADDFSMTVDAGCILAAIQQAAEAADRLFPLSLASEGSATIGGLISTNAGGVAVLRYGTMRALVLGLEAVLPNGQVFNGLTPLRKDNTGYDLKHLLIGAEGTLGIVTGATLKLFPRPAGRCTLFIAVPSADAAVQVLGRLRIASGDQVSAFELVSRYALELVMRYFPTVRDPLASQSDWYVLAELTGAASDAELGAIAEGALASAIEDGLVADAAMAASRTQSADFWSIRELIPEAERRDGGSIHNDVSVAPSRMPEFIERATQALLAEHPDCCILAFGHLGDGNVHFQLRPPPGADEHTFQERNEPVFATLHAILHDMGGSISAEHGIGRLKANVFANGCDPVKFQALAAIKLALDPHNLFGRGRILPVDRL